MSTTTITDAKEAIDNGEWVRKIIASCNNSFHLEAAVVIINLYAQRHGKNKIYEDLIVEYWNIEAMILIP